MRRINKWTVAITAQCREPGCTWTPPTEGIRWRYSDTTAAAARHHKATGHSVYGEHVQVYRYGA